MQSLCLIQGAAETGKITSPLKAAQLRVRPCSSVTPAELQMSLGVKEKKEGKKRKKSLGKTNK